MVCPTPAVLDHVPLPCAPSPQESEANGAERHRQTARGFPLAMTSTAFSQARGQSWPWASNGGPRGDPLAGRFPRILGGRGDDRRSKACRRVARESCWLTQRTSGPLRGGRSTGMKYRKLGHTGLLVSEVALGSMQFGGKMNMGNLGQEDTTRMVRVALDHGINLIDTADVYSLGESETLLGNALKGIRQEIVLATKVRLPMSENFNRSGATRVNILREVDGSLTRLQTEYIDLYQVHGWDSNTPLEETLRTLDDLVRQGKVRHIGLSNYLAWQAAIALGIQKELGLEKYITAQMYYSLVGRDLEHDWMSFAEYT